MMSKSNQIVNEPVAKSTKNSDETDDSQRRRSNRIREKQDIKTEKVIKQPRKRNNSESNSESNPKTLCSLKSKAINKTELDVSESSLSGEFTENTDSNSVDNSSASSEKLSDKIQDEAIREGNATGKSLRPKRSITLRNENKSNENKNTCLTSNNAKCNSTQEKVSNSDVNHSGEEKRNKAANRSIRKRRIAAANNTSHVNFSMKNNMEINIIVPKVELYIDESIMAQKLSENNDFKVSQVSDNEEKILHDAFATEVNDFIRDDNMAKPVKVKSRWWRSSELEGVLSSATDIEPIVKVEDLDIQEGAYIKVDVDIQDSLPIKIETCCSANDIKPKVDTVIREKQETDAEIKMNVAIDHNTTTNVNAVIKVEEGDLLPNTNVTTTDVLVIKTEVEDYDDFYGNQMMLKVSDVKTMENEDSWNSLGNAVKVEDSVCLEVKQLKTENSGNSGNKLIEVENSGNLEVETIQIENFSNSKREPMEIENSDNIEIKHMVTDNCTNVEIDQIEAGNLKSMEASCVKKEQALEVDEKCLVMQTLKKENLIFGEIVKPPHFDKIEENIYRFERKKSKSKKEVRRMLCECMLSDEDCEYGFLGCTDECLNRLLMIECGSRCPTGSACSNKKFQKKQYLKTEAYKTHKKGWGLKSSEDILSGEFVMEFVGEVLQHREYRQRVKQYAKDKSTHCYFMALKTDEIIDATKKGNISRFINHSCDPNCETQKWTVNGELRIGFFARRGIQKGEELTFDYQFQRYGREAQKCYCESDLCTGYIGGAKQISVDSYGGSKSSNKRKKEADEKKKDWEDRALEEEIKKLNGSKGLRNRDETLKLARLMVRADDSQTRHQLLNIIQKTEEQACLRTFLNFHGLPLIWSWMTDVHDKSLKLKILKVLFMLPIQNKTILLQSKVLHMVQKWASDSPIGSLSPSKRAKAATSETQNKSAPIAKKLKDGSDSDSGISPQNPDSNSSESETTNSCKSSDANANETIPVDSQATDVIVDLVCQGKAGESPPKKKSEVAKLCVELLEHWKNLKEEFRIPRLEQQRIVEETRQVIENFPEKPTPSFGSKISVKNPNQSIQVIVSNNADENTYFESRDCDYDFMEKDEIDIHNDRNITLTLATMPTQLSKETRKHSFAVKARNKLKEAAHKKQKEESSCSNRPPPLLTSPSYPGEPPKVNFIPRRAVESSAPQPSLTFPPLQMYQQTPPISFLAAPPPALTLPPLNVSIPQKSTLSQNATATIQNQTLSKTVPLSQNIVVPPNVPVPQNIQVVPVQQNIPVVPVPQSVPAPQNTSVTQNVPMLQSSYSQNSQSQQSNNLPQNIALALKFISIPPNAAIAQSTVPQNVTIQPQLAMPQNINMPSPSSMTRNVNTPVPSAMPQNISLRPPSAMPQNVNIPPSTLPQNISMALTALSQNTPRMSQSVLSQNISISQSSMTPTVSISQSSMSQNISMAQPQNLSIPQNLSLPLNSTVTTCQPMTSGSNPGNFLVPTNQSQVQGTAAQPSMFIPGQSQPLMKGGFPPNQTPFVNSQGQPLYYFQQPCPSSIDTAADATGQQSGAKQPPAAKEEKVTVPAKMKLPPNWRTATDPEGNVYYYHSITRQTQWDPPTADQPLEEDDSDESEDSDTPTYDEPKHSRSKRKTKKAAADTSVMFPLRPDIAKKIKELFRTKISTFVIHCLSSYRKSDCTAGRITTNEDFKYLARKLTHYAMTKELKQCRNVEELDCNDCVKRKTRDFIEKYMAKHGTHYSRKEKSSPADDED